MRKRETASFWRENVIAVFILLEFLIARIGSLSNDDGNENGKKAIGLEWQNNNFARAAHFFAQLQRETS